MKESGSFRKLNENEVIQTVANLPCVKDLLDSLLDSQGPGFKISSDCWLSTDYLLVQIEPDDHKMYIGGVWGFVASTQNDFAVALGSGLQGDLEYLLRPWYRAGIHKLRWVSLYVDNFIANNSSGYRSKLQKQTRELSAKYKNRMRSKAP